MNISKLFASLAACVFFCTAIWLARPLSARPSQGEIPSDLSQELKAFAAIHPIDSHTHVLADSPAIIQWLKDLNLRVLNICVIDKDDPGFEGREPQTSQVKKVFHDTQGRAAWATTFDSEPFETPGYADKVNRQLNEDFAAGAVAVKIYKPIGMLLQKKNGTYLMPDDPVFTPLLDNIAAHQKTVVAHIAEPDSAWESLAEMGPSNPDYGYYQRHPFWHMYLHPERPSKVSILAARDRLLAQHPQLRVVGAHLGSMERDVDEIAKRLDRYPNFAVDTAARVKYLMAQPKEKVRAFLTKYQDRILYGTDRELTSAQNLPERLKGASRSYAEDWQYFATDQVFERKGRKFHGLGLPASVLRKIYHDNAVRWLPGIAQ